MVFRRFDKSSLNNRDDLCRISLGIEGGSLRVTPQPKRISKECLVHHLTWDGEGLRRLPISPLLSQQITYEHKFMKERLEPKRCGAKTRSGSPCVKYPVAGKRRCRLHVELSTGPRTKEGRARIAAANTKHGRYKGWRESRE